MRKGTFHKNLRYRDKNGHAFGKGVWLDE